MHNVHGSKGGDWNEAFKEPQRKEVGDLDLKGLYPVSNLNLAGSGLAENDSLLLVAQWPVWNVIDRFGCDVAKYSGSLRVTQFWPLLCRASLTVT